MFNLAQNGGSILAELMAEAPLLQTVAYLDEQGQSGDYSVEMPCAFLALDKLGPSGGKTINLKPVITWVVLVRGRKLEGPGGMLEVIDQVIDALHGFNPGPGSGLLSFGGVDYYKDVMASVSYAVRFEAGATGKAVNMPCLG